MSYFYALDQFLLPKYVSHNSNKLFAWCRDQSFIYDDNCYSMQKESVKLQLLDILEASVKLCKKQSYQEANVTNICVALLASVKVNYVRMI